MRSDILKKRIETFHAQTKPVIEYYRGKNLLIEVNGQQTREEVFTDVQKACDKTTHYDRH